MPTLAFALQHYGVLALLVAAFWGLGATALAALRVRLADRWLWQAMAVAVGLGLYLVGLQFLGVAGHLRRAPVLALTAFGGALALWQALRGRRQPAATPAAAPWSTPERLGLVLVLVSLAPTLVAPLQPPLRWDEIMYHLPHAGQWALSGRLDIHDWLRFPWFPYNYDLLYSAALLLQDDLLAHLLHALAGWLVALITFRLGLALGSRLLACAATMGWAYLSATQYATAYIDLGLALFVVGAAVACWHWWQEPDRSGWLLVSAFLLGVAAGSKYQALSYLPLFLAALALRERQPRVWLQAALVFLLPCLYWYARNAWYTGDPVDPLGGRWLGFYDWNAWDHQAQLQDVARVAGWPSPALWPALVALGMPSLWRQAGWRPVLVFALYAGLIWLGTSRYTRYLLPAYPALALLSVQAVLRGARWLGQRLPAALRKPQLGVLALAALLPLAGAEAWQRGAKAVERVAVNATERDALLRQLLPGYAAAQALHAYPGRRIYQFALENLAYYLPQPTWGEVFGPWRNHDRVHLPAAALAHRLRAEGFDTVLMRADVAARFRQDADFARHFRLLIDTPAAQAYDILPHD